nr:MAG TPA: hypothetical protein [Caudoviricetes sp.]DAJ00894.1 MAG TPA: hypothetical protein [Caudoviricetes sp.]
MNYTFRFFRSQEKYFGFSEYFFMKSISFFPNRWYTITKSEV